MRSENPPGARRLRCAPTGIVVKSRVSEEKPPTSRQRSAPQSTPRPTYAHEYPSHAPAAAASRKSQERRAPACHSHRLCFLLSSMLSLIAFVALTCVYGRLRLRTEPKHRRRVVLQGLYPRVQQQLTFPSSSHDESHSLAVQKSTAAYNAENQLGSAPLPAFIPLLAISLSRYHDLLTTGAACFVIRKCAATRTVKNTSSRARKTEHNPAML